MISMSHWLGSGSGSESKSEWPNRLGAASDNGLLFLKRFKFKHKAKQNCLVSPKKLGDIFRRPKKFEKKSPNFFFEPY